MPTDSALKRVLAARNMKIVEEEGESHGPSAWAEVSDEMYQAAENVTIMAVFTGAFDEPSDSELP